MKRFLSMTAIALLVTAAFGVSAASADSNRGGQGNRGETPADFFEPDHIWVDEVLYDTLILGSLPYHEQNAHSFNNLYVVDNPAPGQVGPIAEYLPGDPEYRGGRWVPNVVEWTDLSEREVLESLDELHQHLAAGHLTITAHTGGAFLCPILVN